MYTKVYVVQAKYKENVIQRHGPEFDWRAAAPDVEAIYKAGGGLCHGRYVNLKI